MMIDTLIESDKQLGSLASLPFLSKESALHIVCGISSRFIFMNIRFGDSIFSSPEVEPQGFQMLSAMIVKQAQVYA